MADNQLPDSLYYAEVSTDALNLSNYVDQVFKQASVETINIPLLTQTDIDIKLENKINTDANNLTITGQENIQAYNFPADNYIDISSKIQDITPAGATYKTLMYTVEHAGWLVASITLPQQSDFISLNNTTNGMVDSINQYSSSEYIYVKLPVSKYQVVTINYYSVVETNFSYKFIPAGTQTNIGETIAQTRDYKDLMAGIGFPDISRAESFTLQSSGMQTYSDRPGYFSFMGKLNSGDYFSMYTTYTGVDANYNGSDRIHRCLLPVSVGSIVTFEYVLTNTYNFYFIPAIGTKEV